MQKAVLKVYIEKRRRPLFEAEIYDNVEETLSDFVTQLNGPTFVISFGQISFKKELFHHFEVTFK